MGTSSLSITSLAHPAQSADLVERGKKVLMQTYATQSIVLSQGSGAYVIDFDGNKYLDFASGIAVNALGHCHPAYVEAVSSQLLKLSHCSNLYYNLPAIELAEKLIDASPFSRAFFCNSGAEAIEAALKLSRKYTKKYKGEQCTTVLTMSNSFHGRTYGAMSATGQTKYQNGYAPLVPDFKTVVFNDFDSLLVHDPDTVAAIVIEPVQGEGGVHLVDPLFLKKVRDYCTAQKVVLIFDEIQCGIGRSGKFFAWENFGIAPDVVALAKGLGGGFPIGAILATEEVASAFNPGDHGSTFGGNPLAASAALACLSEIKNEGFLRQVRASAEYLEAALLALQAQVPAIKAWRGLGLMQGLELDCPVKPIVQRCAELGLLLVGAGENVIRFLPPLTVSFEEIDGAIAMLSMALA
ncbi:MAG: aspartate aminotransferase family protein [Cyanobacteria bacterium REEB67]|nr:aspartate aminotransferase family protein [Cyanobacteria bacterium REEB67]